MNILLDDKARHLTQTGYGRVAMTIANGLIRNGINHVTVPYKDFDAYEIAPIDNGFFHYDPEALKRLGDFDISISVGNPRSAKSTGLPSLMYTMVDTSDIPSEWVPKLSEMDGFLTPASKITKIFKKHFNNVYEVPLYGDSTVFKPRERWRAEGSEKFSFIFAGTHCYRKGTDILLKAFIREFDNSEAKLTLLCTEKAADPLYNLVIKTMLQYGKISDIEIVTTRLTDSWVARYYSRSDAFVTFSRGEGFGYPLYEAGLCGLSVIAPKKLPSDDFLNSELNYLCDSNKLELSDISDPFGETYKKSCHGVGVSVLDTPIELARQIMRRAYSKGRKKVHSLGLRNASELSRLNSPQIFSQRLNVAIDQFFQSTKDLQWDPN